ncbi:hypothetical protein KsCSTR_00550 [Candidatus Kuenenia stuttgartiensis]|uniref:Uncharacterized protein n=1 Tax=Kuenenia stuttgartiensis TaxID=174633 RepID=A0A6G7GJB1_KUEST|nr:hypothetical protein [uncultured Candidatus Kuenenia sp.]QII09434.1 hypothetical protein KsCSTR_00550 [Candidatus Kuenenia stuttgartiensis]
MCKEMVEFESRLPSTYTTIGHTKCLPQVQHRQFTETQNVGSNPKTTGQRNILRTDTDNKDFGKAVWLSLRKMQKSHTFFIFKLRCVAHLPFARPHN